MSDNSRLKCLVYFVSYLPLWSIVGGVMIKMTITFPNTLIKNVSSLNKIFAEQLSSKVII